MGEPVILASGQGEEIAMGPNAVRVLAETAGWAMAEGSFATGAAGPPRHRHEWDEAFYVLSGKLAVTVGDGATIAWPGDFVLVPGGTPHTFAAHGGEDARFLEFFGTGEGLAYIRELAAAFPADGPPDAAAMAEVHGRYGVEVV